MKKYIIILALFFCGSKSFAAEKKQDSNANNIQKNQEEIPAKIVKKRRKKDEKGIFTYVAENDKFTGTDRGYTNGMRFSYTTSQNAMPDFVQKAASYLPIINKDGKKRINVALGHSMFTPNDTATTELVNDDRPYAAWLYGSLGLISDDDETLDVAVLNLGVVGPIAQGERAQNNVHRLINVAEAYGWRNQIKNEPGVNFTFERKWHNIAEIEPSGFGFDVIPHLGASLGNIDTSAVAGATFRLGYDLPSDYGPPRIRPSLPGSDFFLPSRTINGYLYTTIETRLVARNIFLDGNSFRDSHSVDKKTSVSSLEIGASVVYKDMRVSFANVLLTKEFEGEQGNVRFGVLTLSYRY